MALHITEHEITSTVTEHRATGDWDGWEVSWLPGKPFNRNSAITAMVLVEIYVRDPPPWDKEWLLAGSLEKEIGVTRREDWRG